MTLDHDDITAIAEAVARMLAPKLGLEVKPDPEPEIKPGSFAARRLEALQREAANRAKREKRGKA